MKILVIDDRKNDIWALYEKLLDEEDIEYHAFSQNVISSIEYLKNNPDVVGAFIDLKMPEISGSELASRLLEVRPELKIIFYTGYTIDEEPLKKRFSNNLLGFIYKPVNVGEVIYFLNQIRLNSQQIKIEFFMYGIFDVFVNGKKIDFYCAKSKELLALLVVFQGRSVSKNVILEHLWMNEDKKNVDALYRDARWKLRDILNTYHIGHILSSGKGDLSLNIDSSMSCDYWDKKEKDEKENFNNILLVEYDWANEY